MEKLIDEKINDWRDCLARHSKGEATDRSILIRAVLSDMAELKSSLPKPIEVPQEFKDWYTEIQKRHPQKAAKSWAMYLLCRQGFGHGFTDIDDVRIPYNSKLGNWLYANIDLAIEAVYSDNFTVVKERRWVVKSEKGYLTSLSISQGFSSGWTGNSDKHDSGAILFTDHTRAAAVALIVKGVAVPESEED